MKRLVLSIALLTLFALSSPLASRAQACDRTTGEGCITATPPCDSQTTTDC